MTSTSTSSATETTFDLSAFGAVSQRMVDNSTVEISPARRSAFASEVTHFSALPNTSKRELQMPDSESADMLRLQLRQYARENDLIVGFPVESKDHRQLNSGTTVTYRIAPRRADDSENGDVEVSTVTDAAGAEEIAKKALASVK
jgi:hypothetical protein